MVNMDELKQQSQALRDRATAKNESDTYLRSLLGGSDAVGNAIVETTKANIRHREATTEQTVQTLDTVAKREDITKLADSVDSLLLGTYYGQQDTIAELAPLLKKISAKLSHLPHLMNQDGFAPLIDALKNLPEPKEDVSVTNLGDLEGYFTDLRLAVEALRLNPSINVAAPVVNVKEPDMSVLSDYLDSIAQTLAKIASFKPAPTPKFDASPITDGLKELQNSINSLSFPVANPGSNGKFITTAFDEVDITSYTANNDPAIVIYKNSGKTVATLTITYDGSNRITSVVKS